MTDTKPLQAIWYHPSDINDYAAMFLRVEILQVLREYEHEAKAFAALRQTVYPTFRKVWSPNLARETKDYAQLHDYLQQPSWAGVREPLERWCQKLAFTQPAMQVAVLCVLWHWYEEWSHETSLSVDLPKLRYKAPPLYSFRLLEQFLECEIVVYKEPILQHRQNEMRKHIIDPFMINPVLAFLRQLLQQHRDRLRSASTLPYQRQLDLKPWYVRLIGGGSERDWTTLGNVEDWQRQEIINTLAWLDSWFEHHASGEKMVIPGVHLPDWPPREIGFTYEDFNDYCQAFPIWASHEPEERYRRMLTKAFRSGELYKTLVEVLTPLSPYASRKEMNQLFERCLHRYIQHRKEVWTRFGYQKSKGSKTRHRDAMAYVSHYLLHWSWAKVMKEYRKFAKPKSSFGMREGAKTAATLVGITLQHERGGRPRKHQPKNPLF